MRKYPNLLSELGLTQKEITQKINDTFNTIFFDSKEKFYFDAGNDMGYMLDTGNFDARTEGMSYGMMMAVQLDRKDIFDKLWLFSVKYMLHTHGKYEGYFAWSVKPDGTRNYEGPAPDGEEYYAMALFFASKRWGDGDAPFDYSIQARKILHHCIHQSSIAKDGDPMWDPDNYLIKFIPETPFSDPSYHLPHFYRLFALRANEADRSFWNKASDASRKYIALSAHPVTGMAPEYAEFDGTPRQLHDKVQQFYSDSYRVAMNIGLDAAWNGITPDLRDVVNRLQIWFADNTKLGEYDSYMLDGTALGIPAMHPVAIIATNAAASLASDNQYKMKWVEDFWKTPPATGDRRYYDNCLYFFCLLMLAGEYKIY